MGSTQSTWGTKLKEKHFKMKAFSLLFTSALFSATFT